MNWSEQVVRISLLLGNYQRGRSLRWRLWHTYTDRGNMQLYLSTHFSYAYMRVCVWTGALGCGCLKRAEGAHLPVAGVTGHCWSWSEMGTGNQTQTICSSPQSHKFMFNVWDFWLKTKANKQGSEHLEALWCLRVLHLQWGEGLLLRSSMFCGFFFLLCFFPIISRGKNP